MNLLCLICMIFLIFCVIYCVFTIKLIKVYQCKLITWFYLALHHGLYICSSVRPLIINFIYLCYGVSHHKGQTLGL